MKIFDQFPALTDATLLQDLPANVLEPLLGASKLVLADAVKPILHQGRPADCVYLIAEGSVEISYKSSDDYKIIIGHGGPNRTLGAIEVVAERPCLASCTLHAGAAAITWEPETILKALDVPVFRKNFAALAYTALEHDNASKAIDQYYSAEQRICRYLGRLAADQRTFQQSQGYLATAVGCTRQTVNKELSLLKQRDVIEIAKGKIVIVDREGLENRIRELDDRSGRSRT